MTKNIIFIIAALCSLQARADVQPTERDTVHRTYRYDDTELLQPLQPLYLDGVVVPARGNGNWFVSIAGGATAFLGTPLGCEDLFGRLKPSCSLALGKWFTPRVGARRNYNGLLFHATNGHNPFAFTYGIQGQNRISKRVSALMELSGTTTFQDFDGYGKANRLGDHMLSLTAGFSFHIGKVGWKRAIDPSPYIRRDRQLVDYINVLSEQNSRYAGQHDKDSRTLAELKKILEIEGLLDTYSHFFDDDDAIERKGYPRNNYSGLNSLRARLKKKHWNGKSPLEGQAPNGNGRAERLQHRPDSVPGLGTGQFENAPASTLADSAVRMQSGRECIGAPFFFFFELGTSHLTDPSQLVNLDELARVAKKYGLSVSVIGAADSMTGTVSVNNALSVSRAGYIAEELIKRGVLGDKIVQTHQGGISDYTPNEANRHTKVMLYFK